MERTKIDIISGFLGAGKTTFIKKLIQELYQKEKVVILENEFGRINIDEETLGREGLIVKPIQAGCICCSSSMDLFRGIDEIIKEYQPERIIVEPTGVAKLSEIRKLFDTMEMQHYCVLDHVITIVDAKNYYARTMISKDFFEDQIRSSVLMFLSKTSELKKDKLLQVKSDILKIKPNCLVVDEDWEQISASNLKEYMKYTPETTGSIGLAGKITMRKNHSNDFDRYEIMKDDNYDIADLSLFIKNIENGSYGEIHRLKGISVDTVQGSYSVDYIPGETIIKTLTRDLDNSSKEHSIRKDEVWHNGIMLTKTRLCLIGRNLDKEKLDEIFYKELLGSNKVL